MVIETLDDIEDFARETYSGLEIHNMTGDGYVKLTNGSGGHEVRISINDDHLKLVGIKFGEKIDTRCGKTVEELEKTLSKTL